MRATIVPLLLVLAAASTHAAAADVADGQRAFDGGRFTEALRAWLPLAQAGDPQAAFDLGLLYDLGNGVDPDPAAALRWYEQAAEAGLPAAEFNVAVMLDSGRGVRRDAPAAALWYARAAAHGHLRAEYDLGQLYESGDGVPRNPQVAAAWYAQAAPSLAAAADRLVRLRDRLNANGGRDTLAVPELQTPADGAALSKAGIDARAVELVWTAVASGQGSRFFVELRSLDGDNPGQVFAGYTNVSGLLVKLPAGARQFAWRVQNVSAAPAHYASTAWRTFTLADDPQPKLSDAGSERLDDHHDHDH